MLKSYSREHQLLDYKNKWILKQQASICHIDRNVEWSLRICSMHGHLTWITSPFANTSFYSQWIDLKKRERKRLEQKWLEQQQNLYEK